MALVAYLGFWFGIVSEGLVVDGGSSTTSFNRAPHLGQQRLMDQKGTSSSATSGSGSGAGLAGFAFRLAFGAA